MATEIERKFLVNGDGWRSDLRRSAQSRQGYLSYGPKVSVRVRIMGSNATLTMKQAVAGPSRVEFEYAIPIDDANELLDASCEGSVVEKTRHWVEFEGYEWEIDEFTGANAPLVVAELELSNADEGFPRPPWIGDEVTGDERYYNASLSRRPYSAW